MHSNFAINKAIIKCEISLYGVIDYSKLMTWYSRFGFIKSTALDDETIFIRNHLNILQ